MNQSNRIYKIRHRKSGLYSTGGMYPRWSRAGKTWCNLGRLRSHLSQHLGTKYRSGTDMSEWMVVEIEVRELAYHDCHEILSPKQLMSLLAK